jgi:hypothetical protein
MKSIRGHSIGLKFTSSLWIRLLLLLHAANSCGHEAAASAAAAAATGFFFNEKTLYVKNMQSMKLQQKDQMELVESCS